MDIHNLVHMANQIGEFFSAYPDRNEAMEGIATHIRKFWEPRMRKEIEAHVAKGGAGLDALVVEAVKKLQKH